jgi:hypothetical protein
MIEYSLIDYGSKTTWNRNGSIIEFGVYHKLEWCGRTNSYWTYDILQFMI